MIKLIDLTGREYATEIIQQTTSVEVILNEPLAKGMYMLMITGDGVNKSVRVIHE